MISYEVSIGLIMVPVIICSGSLNLTEIVFVQSVNGWFCFQLCPLTVVFCISVLAETNRAPFRFAGLTELVAGFNVEYSSMGFVFFFLGESCSKIHETNV
jgi:NADH-quinone oxidoreductase subunit H